MNVTLRFLALTLLPWSTLFAQSKKGSGKPDAPTGPSLTETTQWLENEAPALMRAYESKVENGVYSSTVYHTVEVHLKDCTLSWASADTFQLKSAIGGSSKVYASQYSVAMKALEVGSIAVAEVQLLGEKPIQFIRLKQRAAEHGPFITESTNGAAPKVVEQTQFYVRTKDDGARVAKALQRAALLCGAPPSPF